MFCDVFQSDDFRSASAVNCFVLVAAAVVFDVMAVVDVIAENILLPVVASAVVDVLESVILIGIVDNDAVVSDFSLNAAALGAKVFLFFCVVDA
jgi:hypothetical protein